MTMLGVMLERHGRQLPIVNGVPAYSIKPSSAIRADPCNNVPGAPKTDSMIFVQHGPSGLNTANLPPSHPAFGKLMVPLKLSLQTNYVLALPLWVDYPGALTRSKAL